MIYTALDPSRLKGIVILAAAAVAVTALVTWLLRMRRYGKAVYIIGAGLSKSVAIDGFPVPLMGDFVSVAAFYAATDDVLLTTLAELEVAGVFANSDANSRFLAARVSDPKKATSQDREDFLRLMGEERNENIEQLLLRAKELANQPTHAAEPIAIRIAREELRKRFRFAINRVFYLVGWNVNVEPLRRFLADEIRRCKASTFVTFNYDLILEHVIEEVRVGWSASSGYSTLFDQVLDVEDANAQIAHFATAGGGAVGTVPFKAAPSCPLQSSVLVIKPHGSLNWLAPFEKNYEFTEAASLLALRSDDKVGYLSGFDVQLVEKATGMPWPNVGIFISAPTEKTPIPKMIQKEMAALREADDLFVIGWSAPKTDIDQLELIESAVASRSKPFRRVVIIDTTTNAHHYERMHQLFGNAGSFEPWNKGFQAFVKTHTHKQQPKETSRAT